ncbi:YDG/SRA domain-containing protein [Limibacter armeniacum]|uniref:YDG/SRA domain-containing protein n=1 Tax=Limibacter armeniacum TaxID=466084 RepID=UPI002FE51AE3
MRVFGEIKGVIEGQLFGNRILLAEAGIHKPHVAGISGSENEGADSIVISGGYVDDEDLGVFTISESFEIIGLESEYKKLTVHKKHNIDKECLKYHREHHYKK